MIFALLDPLNMTAIHCAGNYNKVYDGVKPERNLEARC